MEDDIVPPPIDYTKNVPDAIMLQIFSLLPRATLFGKAAAVNKHFFRLTSIIALQILNETGEVYKALLAEIITLNKNKNHSPDSRNAILKKISVAFNYLANLAEPSKFQAFICMQTLLKQQYMSLLCTVTKNDGCQYTWQTFKNLLENKFSLASKFDSSFFLSLKIFIYRSEKMQFETITKLVILKNLFSKAKLKHFDETTNKTILVEIQYINGYFKTLSMFKYTNGIEFIAIKDFDKIYIMNINYDEFMKATCQMITQENDPWLSKALETTFNQTLLDQAVKYADEYIQQYFENFKPVASPQIF